MFARMADSRIKVIAFSFPGKEEICDKICQSAFLGNYWDLGPNGLQIQAPNNPGDFRSFRNAEAALVALRYWDRADELAEISGEQAAQLRDETTGHEDFSYCGYGSNWNAMFAVLRQKFKPGSELAELLSGTGEAFLLNRVYAKGTDMVWSDNNDGSGLNWLGMQLMLIRDEVRKTEGRWTKAIRMAVDITSGQSYSEVSVEPWQEAVDIAVDAVAFAEEEREKPLPI